MVFKSGRKPARTFLELSQVDSAGLCSRRNADLVDGLGVTNDGEPNHPQGPRRGSQASCPTPRSLLTSATRVKSFVDESRHPGDRKGMFPIF